MDIVEKCRECREVIRLEEAKTLINEYAMDEFQNSEVCYVNLHDVGLAYTTVEDESGKEHDLQISVDLVDFKLNTYLDWKIVKVERYGSLEIMIDELLSFLEFDSLIMLDEDVDDLLKRGVIK